MHHSTKVTDRPDFLRQSLVFKPCSKFLEDSLKQDSHPKFENPVLAQPQDIC